MDRDSQLVTGLSKGRDNAARDFLFSSAKGYHADDVNGVFPDDTAKRDLTAQSLADRTTALGNKAAGNASVGGVLGGVAGGIIGTIAAAFSVAGTSLAISDLVPVVAEALAAALVGGGVGAVGGGLLGALVGWNIAADRGARQPL